jgi:hypothetical protein
MAQAQQEFEDYTLYKLSFHIELGAAAGVSGSKEAAKAISKAMDSYKIKEIRSSSDDYADSELEEIAKAHHVPKQRIIELLDTGWTPSINVRGG